jgi:hypothetical protein
MKLYSIFLAAVMIFALAGQAAEARDRDGWRTQVRLNNNWNRGLHRGWYKNQWNNNRRYQAWNQNRSWGRPSGRPWDTMENRSWQALQIMNAQNRYANPYWNRYWY